MWISLAISPRASRWSSAVNLARISRKGAKPQRKASDLFSSRLSAFARNTAPSLEIHTQHELQNSSAGFDCAADVAVRTADLSERRADVVVVRAARADTEVRQVENVQRRRAELD